MAIVARGRAKDCGLGDRCRAGGTAIDRDGAKSDKLAGIPAGGTDIQIVGHFRHSVIECLDDRRTSSSKADAAACQLNRLSAGVNVDRRHMTSAGNGVAHTTQIPLLTFAARQVADVAELEIVGYIELAGRSLPVPMVWIHCPSAGIDTKGIGNQLGPHLGSLQIDTVGDAALYHQNYGVIARMTAAVAIAAPIHPTNAIMVGVNLWVSFPSHPRQLGLFFLGSKAAIGPAPSP